MNQLEIDPFDLDEERRKITEIALISSGKVVIASDEQHTGKCPICGREWNNIQTRRLNTRYHEESSNWLESCFDCYKDAIDHYNELWAEYRSSQGY